MGDGLLHDRDSSTYQICSQVVKTVKGDNAKQHFRRNLSHAKLEGESKKICVENLKKSVRQQTSCVPFMKSTNSRCEASYRSGISALAFLMDFLTHVDNPNQSLQGKGTTICFVNKTVLDFQDKYRH